MAPEWSRRKTLHLSSSAVLAALAGCSTLGFGAEPQVDTSMGTTAPDVVIDGQPTTDGVIPAVWGITFAHPDAARKLIDWGALTPEEGDEGPGTAFRSFDPNEQFMSVVVGVLPTGDALTSYREDADNVVEDIAADFAGDSIYENGRLRYDVTSYQAFEPDADTPDYHYDYTFTLWHLNGADRPSGIDVTYRDS